MTAEMNAARPCTDTRARLEGDASCHSRCQSAINGSKVRRTVASSNHRDANASARDVIAIKLPLSGMRHEILLRGARQ